MFKFSRNSLRKLSTVDESLQRVIARALELTEVDFGVVQGKRTLKEQQRLYGKGRTAGELMKVGVPTTYARPRSPKVTWTMNSNHLSGRAVDLAAWRHGEFDWGTIQLYRKIAAAVKQAAMELCVPIVWGGDWETADWGHFELVREE